MSRISIIIVSWNAREFLRGCLSSIYATADNLVREVVVVDNASRDGSPEMVAAEFSQVKLIRSTENLGFAKANNLGLEHCTGEFIALVNSDVIVHPDCFQKLVRYFDEHQEAGLIGPKVFGRDGKIQKTCGRLPTVWNTAMHFFGFDKIYPKKPLFRGFQMTEEEHIEGCPVECLSGCFCIARRAAVQQIGGLDERFFFYAEDVDWSKRFIDHGWRLAYVTDASIIHFGGGSSSNAPLKYTIEMLRANLLYWRKHHGAFGRLIYYCLAVAQHFCRLLARCLFLISRRSRSEYNRIKLKEHVICIRWLFTGRGVS